MSITVGKLIEYLKLYKSDLEVYTCHGASGAVDEVGSPNLAKANSMDIGMGLDLNEGTEYVSLYTGN